MTKFSAWGAAFAVGAFAPLLLAATDTIQQYDPAQYAEVARRMFESGDWAHLRDAFGPYLDKPPLTFWLINGSFWLFGETSFAVRLPVLILGAVLLYFTYRIGSLLWDQRTGLLAAAFVSSSIAFLIMIAD